MEYNEHLLFTSMLDTIVGTLHILYLVKWGSCILELIWGPLAVLDTTKITTFRTRTTILCKSCDCFWQWHVDGDATSTLMHSIADARFTSPLFPCHMDYGSLWLCKGATEQISLEGGATLAYSFLREIVTFACVRNKLLFC